MTKEEYLPVFDAICSVLGVYEPSDSEGKFRSFLSRINRSIKNGEIDFSYTEKGKRYIHVKKLKTWSNGFNESYAKIETEEKRKLDNLKKKNVIRMERNEIVNQKELLDKAEKHEVETEAKIRAAVKSTKKKQESKEYCISLAVQLWNKKFEDDDEIYRVGEMCELLKNELKNHPDMFHTKSIDTVRNWLKIAEKNGKLIIPMAAKKPGRPKKRN